MNALRKFSCLALACAFCSSQALADDHLWLGVKAGTLGLGAEATWKPLPWFDVRGGFNIFDYDDDGSQSGINYDATLELQTVYATANFHLPASPLRFTAGMYSNDNELELVSEEAPGFDIGGTIYTANEVGTLTSATTFDSLAPYAGIGFDFGLFGRLGLSLDVGVLLQGDPKVTLAADGTLANDPGFMAALEQERVELEDEVDKLEVYPVLSLGLNFNFL